MRQFKASHMYARITGRKARLAADLIRGMPVNRALEVLEFTHRRSARLLEKVVKSALANARLDTEVNVNRLFVAESRVDDGPLLGGRARWRPGSRGRAMPYRKRTSHLRIGLAEAPEPILAAAPPAEGEASAPPARKSTKAKAAGGKSAKPRARAPKAGS